MMISAVLSNADHPEYGAATIPFPIPKEHYDQCMELVKALKIGNPFKKDCKVMSVDSDLTVLKNSENLCVNLDELDYLAKRLESFDVDEAAQFQAMASKLELFELKDLINLTFCCQQVTVISDFSKLEQIGRDHYMNTHGGCVGAEEMENLDGMETAILLIDGGGGAITRYGVVYDNGMKLDQIYDGKYFPDYYYEQSMLTVALTSRQEPENTKNITWIYLPAAKGQIERAMARSGITDPEDMRFRFAESLLPDEVDAALDFCSESIYDLNEMAMTVSKLSNSDWRKLGAVVTMVEPEYASQIRHLAENLDQFEFAPGVQNSSESRMRLSRKRSGSENRMLVSRSRGLTLKSYHLKQTQKRPKQKVRSVPKVAKKKVKKPPLFVTKGKNRGFRGRCSAVLDCSIT